MKAVLKADVDRKAEELGADLHIQQMQIKKEAGERVFLPDHRSHGVPQATNKQLE